jgi:hypothetical protein
VLAIALFGIVMLETFSRHLNRELELMNISSATRQEIGAQRNKLAAIKVPAELRRSVDDSFVAGFRLVMSINAALALASAASAWLMIRDER